MGLANLFDKPIQNSRVIWHVVLGCDLEYAQFDLTNRFYVLQNPLVEPWVNRCATPGD